MTSQPITPDEIFLIVRQHLVEALDGLEPERVSINDQMTDIGANSLDRMDVAVLAQHDLGIKVDPRRFNGVRDIRSLVETLHGAVTQQIGRSVPR